MQPFPLFLARGMQSTYDFVAPGGPGSWILSLLATIGLLILVGGVLRSGVSSLQGDTARSIRLVLTLVVLVALLFRPTLVVQLLDFGGDLVGRLLRSIGAVADGANPDDPSFPG